MDGFVHLHTHSHYSLLDGCSQLEDLVSAAKSAGMDALALTDHGNLFGAVEFYRAATSAGIKPILGIEAYISPTTRFDRSMKRIDTAAYHVALLARFLTVLLLAVLVVRDILRPSGDPVRAGGDDDPAGGVLDDAPDAFRLARPARTLQPAT